MVRELQAVTEQVEWQNIDDLIEEFKTTAKDSVDVVNYFMELRRHGVRYLDDSFNPVDMGNVIPFPTTRRLQ